MISKVLSRQEFVTQPPVLIDIGASGKIHTLWKKIAKYCICVAFDADERDFDYIEKQKQNYRTLHVQKALVADFSAEKTPFYLTQSPHCSSLLPPDAAGLKGTFYADKFEVEKIVYLPTVSLKETLSKLNLTYVDWFKTDSQGIDLRLFKNLGADVIKKVLIAEFEPGIINAYQGEDKMHEILAFMEQSKSFWLAECLVKGSAKIAAQDMQNIFKQPLMQKLAMFSHKKMAGWVELIYLNNLSEVSNFTLRDRLLAWVLATLLQQHGFALHIAQETQTLFPEDNMLASMLKYSRNKIRYNVWKLQFYPAIITKIKQLLGK